MNYDSSEAAFILNEVLESSLQCFESAANKLFLLQNEKLSKKMYETQSTNLVNILFTTAQIIRPASKFIKDHYPEYEELVNLSEKIIEDCVERGHVPAPQPIMYVYES